MDVYEVVGFPVGIDNSGVNFLSPVDSFQNILNGYVYKQELQSRKGFSQFGNRLSDGSRVMGIFEHIKPDDSKVLLVISQEYLYKFNTTTNQFDQIPNNSADAFVSFGIADNSYYVSGTTYPFPNNSERFVFTGVGMSDIYFYDGTQVKRFTNTTDNPDYVPPSSGALTKATYVLWFGERLNLFVPVIASVAQSQAVLYSGIRNTAGAGDDFNTPGSGMLSADTYEYITGAVIAGDYILINFNRSSWTLEKTRDAFNPYFIRRIPSVLGTDAPFSAVTWDNETTSIGRTGIIRSDGRNSLRIDSKVPYFTQNDIKGNLFTLTYGGFDRVNGQFLFSYRDANSNLTPQTQDRVLVRNYEEETWAINTQRFSVFGQTILGIDYSWDEINDTNNPSWARMDETEEIWNRIGLSADEQKTLAGDDMGFIYQLEQDFDDYFINITAITVASSAVVTVDPCALLVGDVVYFANVGGMTEINGLTGTIIAVGTTSGATTSITVDIDSSGYTAYTSGGSASKVIDFYAEMVPFNPYRTEGRKVWLSHAEFLLNTHSGNLSVSVFCDEEESPFKEDVLLQPSSETTRQREWITLIVNQEANFITFSMKQDSVSTQVVVTSIRLHCKRGGMTSG